MPFNGSGTFNVYTPGNPVVTGTTISSTVQNNTMSDFATGLSDCMTRDGQSPATANIPMGNNKLTGLANGTVATDAAALGQVQSAASQAATTSGTNTILLTVSPTVLAYSAGQVFRFVAANSNTAACTVNVDSVGASNLYKRMSGGLVALVANDIIAACAYEIVYDGTQFELIGQTPYTQGADVLSATTTALDATTGDYIHITGTTTITAITLAQGAERTVVFNGALTLTNGASLILPGAANITTAAGDTAIFRGEASSVVRCIMYQRAAAGSFTATLTGVNATVTGTAYYTITNNTVVLDLPKLNGTSNTTACTITGLPAAIQPVSQKGGTLLLADNGAAFMASMTLSAGTVTFYGPSPGFSATGFTNSGTKGMSAPASFSYTLN